MNRLLTLSRYCFLIVAVVVAGALFSACSDEPSGPPPPAGSSTITVMHANADYSSTVRFARDTAVLADDVVFGVPRKATIPNGNSKIVVRSSGGTELKSADVSLDSTFSSWVIFGGTLASPDAFVVKTKKLTPSAGSCAVRVVNASNNAGNVSVRLNSTAGPAFTAEKIPYKGASAYVELQLTTVSLVVNKEDNSGIILTITTGAGTFQAGKSYTVVIYGSTDPNAGQSVRIQSLIMED
jgi:hypothetical protein